MTLTTIIGGGSLFDTPIKFIEGGVALLLTTGLITLAIFLFNSGKSMSTAASDTMNLAAKSIEDSEYTKFLNTKVSGSDVLSFIRKHAGDLKIDVYTKTTTGEKNREFVLVSDLDNFTNVPSNTDFYVNPAAYFTAQVERNANDAITKIEFKQIKPTNNTGDADTIISSDPTMDMDSDTIKRRLDVLEANIESVLTKLSNGSLASKEDINDLLLEIAKLKSELDDNTDKTNDIMTYLQSVSRQINALNSGYNAVVSDLRTILSLYSELSNNDASLQSQIESLKQSVDALPSIIAANTTDVSSLYTSVQTMIDQLTTVQQSLADILQRTIAISEQLGQTEYTSELRSMSNSVDESAEVVNALKSGLEVLE